MQTDRIDRFGQEMLVKFITNISAQTRSRNVLIGHSPRVNIVSKGTRVHIVKVLCEKSN
jgi:hypothetical protein